MEKSKLIPGLFNVDLQNTDALNKKNSPEPNDGSFIEKNPKDSFSSEGTVRYGEETDVDDI